MNILTVNNTALSLDMIPEITDDDVYFSILDNRDIAAPDFFFVPLHFLELFSSPATVLQIGNHRLTMPVDWSILIGDANAGKDLEVIPLTSLNARGFDAFVYNPLTSYRLEFQPIKIIDFYYEIDWHFPKLQTNQLLTIPLETGDNPMCAFFVKNINRQNEIIRLDLLI